MPRSSLGFHGALPQMPAFCRKRLRLTKNCTFPLQPIGQPKIPGPICPCPVFIPDLVGQLQCAYDWTDAGRIVNAGCPGRVGASIFTAASFFAPTGFASGAWLQNQTAVRIDWFAPHPATPIPQSGSRVTRCQFSQMPAARNQFPRTHWASMPVTRFSIFPIGTNFSASNGKIVT